MTLLIEALSGVLDTFLLYLFASGFYSKYRSTKYKGHLYLLVGIFIIVMSCIPMPGILRILLSWSIISVSTYAIFESTVRKALLTSTAFITLSVLVDVICEYPFYLSGISRTVILGQGLARCIFIIFAKLINLLLILFIVTLFGDKQYQKMAALCTGDAAGFDYSSGVFGMKEAKLKSCTYNGDYSAREKKLVFECSFAMKPAANSVYDPNQTNTTCLIYVKKVGSQFLIDEFASGF